MISSQATSYWFTFKTTFLQQKKNGSYICLIQGNEHINTRPSDWKLNYVLLTNHKKKKIHTKASLLKTQFLPQTLSSTMSATDVFFLARSPSIHIGPLKISPRACVWANYKCVCLYRFTSALESRASSSDLLHQKARIQKGVWTQGGDRLQIRPPLQYVWYSPDRVRVGRWSPIDSH